MATTLASRVVPQTWIVHREMALLLGWPRAILMQFAHPLVAQGVADHSTFTTDRRGRWQRLHRTLGAMLTLTFGTEADARAVIARINGIHDRVSGVVSETVGPVAPGTRYTARDPELLLWVHATCVQSFLLAYETFVAPLTPDDRDRYCAESAEGAGPFGIPAGWIPRRAVALDGYVSEMVTGRSIVVTDVARALASEVVAPRSAGALRPAFALLRLATAALLPAPIRDAYGFAWGPRRARAFDATARGARAILPRLPCAVRCWPTARAAFARAARSD